MLVYLTIVFNLDNVTAANIINIFRGSTNISTLLGAFFSDTFFGRYNTLAAIGLGIPAALMFVACVVFFVGTKLYVRLKPNGSPIKSIIQVLVVAVKKRRLKVPSQHPMISLFDYVPPNSLNLKLSSTNQFRVLDKAAMITPHEKINPDGSPADPWSLCSIQQVEELKCLVRVLPILFFGILFFLSITQQ
ncbi:unnamed protein product [Vicia faba]|uniref:Uncharacterized protein n=1 Tax=Vicia faba TaxID=3906 RepID=A0AAV1AIZ5_VICFA|nr:unnamed protein product [Vicia faba]